MCSRASCCRGARQSRPNCRSGGHPLVAPSVQAQRTLPEEKNKCLFLQAFYFQRRMFYFSLSAVFIFFLWSCEFILSEKFRWASDSGLQPCMFSMAATCTYGRHLQRRLQSVTVKVPSILSVPQRWGEGGGEPEMGSTGLESAVRLR